MSAAIETQKYSSTETLPQKEVPQIEGVLREPILQPIGDDQLSISYHWEASDDRHTYLNLLLRKSPDDPYGVVHTNIDSEDIKGQGDALWTFIGDQVQKLSNQGNFVIRDEVDVNDYSRRLPATDPRYVQVAENKYVGVYTPQAHQG